MAETADTPNVSATVVGQTDVGRMREHNEDHFLVLNRADGRSLGSGERLDVKLTSAIIMSVADGMGGAAAGEVASRMASERLQKNLGEADFSEATPDQITALLDHAIQQANEEIHTEAKDNSERRGMGTTLTAAIAMPGRMFISQVGDSRGYLLRKGKLLQLTRDQSLVGQLIEEGTLTEEEAEKLGARNIVLQAVGVEETLRVDTRHWEVLRGDVFLLCSDGLSGMVRDDQLQDIVNENADDPRRAVELLVEAANEAGGRDNITAILACFDGESLRAPLESATAGVEKAGASFKAPPPPEVPNPMKKVGAALAAVIAVICLLFLVLRRTTAEIEVSWTPANVAAVLTLAPSEGGEAQTLSATGGSARFLKVEPGEYRVAATADGYFQNAKTVPIKEPGDVAVSLTLVPKPGNVEIRTTTPNLRIRVEAPGLEGAQPYEADFDWPDPTKTKRTEKVPAGLVRVRATRAGFESWEREETLIAEGTVTFEIPALVEVKGQLTILCDAAGFEVTVVDRSGEPLVRTTTDGSRQDLDVRVGTHEIRANKAGYAQFSREVTIEKDGPPVEVVIATTVSLVAVTFVSATPTSVKLQVQTADGAWADVPGRGIYIRETGSSRAKELAPGKYRAVWDGKTRDFDVLAGRDKATVELE